MNYPRVLIIGQYFDKKSGAGITMTNLFSGWDKNNIAVAASEINTPDFSVCEKFYRIGHLEIKRGFPFNLKLKEETSRSGIIQNNPAPIISDRPIRIKESRLGKIKDNLLFLTGQIHRRRRFEASNQFLNWINEFSPDIIYTQLSSLELIRFINTLQKVLKKPLVIHIMDDWPITISNGQKGIFRSYWSQIIDKEFRNLLSKADVLLSISESMSDEYLVRYGKDFTPFHNPIDVKKWTPSTKKDYLFKDSFKILYAGRIGTGLQNCLLDFAYAIQNLINKGLKIEFHIQATIDNPVLNELAKFDFVTLRSVAEYSQLPDIFSGADLLLLPNDFDKKSVSFLKYSMPTKASEYMVSGTPILVFSSSETAITKHALKYGWAYVVAENTTVKLETAICELYEDSDLRISIGNRAKDFALKHFDSDIIRASFKNSIQN